jgi:hypothetical protein
MEGMMSIRASFQQQAKRYAGRGARNIMAAAGIGLIAATAVVAPGYAQQATPIAATNEITADTTCKDYKPGQFGQSAICEIKKGVVLRAQERVLDQQLVVLANERKCTDFLKNGITSGSLNREAVRAAYNGRPVQQVPACDIAGKFGYTPDPS